MADTSDSTGRTGRIPSWIWFAAALAAAIVVTVAIGTHHPTLQDNTKQAICNINKQSGITSPDC